MTVAKEKNDLEKLEDLLDRRKNYFLLPLEVRIKFVVQFERIQRDIINIKLRLEIYQDELDLFSLKFNYVVPEAKRIFGIIEMAQERREIKWLRKIYNPASHMAEYIGKIYEQGIISDMWLQEKYLEHQAKRDGYIDCPWPTFLEK